MEIYCFFAILTVDEIKKKIKIETNINLRVPHFRESHRRRIPNHICDNMDGILYGL